MKTPFPILAALLPLWFACCKSEPTEEEEQTLAPPEVVPELTENRISEVPSSLLTAASKSKINWQPWSPDVLDHAQRSQRLILAMIASPRYPDCFKTLEALDKSTSLCNRINQSFVPVLADLDLNRETSLIAYHLSSLQGNNISFPFLMVLSPDGNPVSWHSLYYTSDRDVYGFFDNTIEVIKRMWEDRDYVTRDSASKAETRKANLPEPDEPVTEPGEQRRMYEDSVRQILSGYDPDIATMANSGGLFPLGVLDLLTVVSCDPEIDESQRAKATEILDNYVPTLIGSAMVDPLDGGIQSARKGSSWNIVLGQRDCATQARAVRTFARMHQLHEVPGTLETAVNAARFAESRFQTPDGMFSLTSKPSSFSEKDWLWKIDQVSSVLSEEEFAVWKSYSELKAIGNLPSESDPSRNYFRLNSLYAGRSPEEVAEATGFEIGKVRTLIESGRKKLLKAREDRVPSPSSDPLPSALASFRMISSYASLYAATGEAEWLENAINLGKACRAHFLKSRFLNERPDAEAEGMSDGRAFTYAIAVQAGLDLGDVTLEDEWNLWAHDLTTLLSEHFVSDDGRLLEVRSVSSVMDIDIENRVMVFDDSTAGLVRTNLQRLNALGFQTHPGLRPWLSPTPAISRFPIIYTDSIVASSLFWNHVSLRVGPDSPTTLVDEIRRLPLQLFIRRTDDGTGVRTITPEGDEKTLNDLEALKSLSNGL
ncbi:MAG: DUF255 domain-containing protein [Verrucomicrobiota bacterium]